MTQTCYRMNHSPGLTRTVIHTANVTRKPPRLDWVGPQIEYSQSSSMASRNALPAASASSLMAAGTSVCILSVASQIHLQGQIVWVSV